MFDNFFFIALPYIALLSLIGGTAYRAFTGLKTAFRGRLTWGARGDFLWTTRSTGYFGRASIGPEDEALGPEIARRYLGALAGAAYLRTAREAVEESAEVTLVVRPERVITQDFSPETPIVGRLWLLAKRLLPPWL